MGGRLGGGGGRYIRVNNSQARTSKKDEVTVDEKRTKAIGKPEWDKSGS